MVDYTLALLRLQLLLSPQPYCCPSPAAIPTMSNWPYYTSSPCYHPSTTAAQVLLLPQLARPAATTVAPSLLSRSHYSSSSPYYCPSATLLAMKWPLLLPQPYCSSLSWPSPSAPKPYYCPIPTILFHQPRPFFYPSAPALPRHSTTLPPAPALLLLQLQYANPENATSPVPTQVKANKQ